MRALFSGVTGIRSHQVRMDVIGNNIANVNTTGFRSSRVTFMDVLNQTMSSGSAQTNPQQIGLGVAVASTDLNNTPGSFQLTGRALDMAIEGNGMFVLRSSSGQISYTRAGGFDFDSLGNLVNPGTGQRVQGWLADANGDISKTDPGSMGDIRINMGDAEPPVATTMAAFKGNLDAGAATGDTYETIFTAYDSLGRPHSIPLRFTKTSATAWQWQFQSPPPAGSTTGTWTTGGTVTFDAAGKQAPTTTTTTINILNVTPANNLAVSIDFRTLTHYHAGTAGSNVIINERDGRPMGVMEAVTIDDTGVVLGVYTNGSRRKLAQVALANFTNPAGLSKVGSNAFAETLSSGEPQIGRPNSGGRGRLMSGNLEMSNVDISTEFTNMIMTQRGFQANTRVVSSADEMLNDVINMRR